MSTPSVVDICRALEKARSHYGIGQLSGQAFDLKAADAMLVKLDALAKRFSDLVIPKARGHYPSNVEKVAVLTIALDRIANRDGALIIPADTLLAKVVDACPTPDAAKFWAKEWPTSLFGLVLHESKLATELQTRGVLVWGEHSDGLTRMVNTSWLTAHADIFRFVTGDRPPGPRCRFCRLPEPHNAKPFQEVATPSGDWKVAQPRITESAQLHPQCVPSWLEWVSIARLYASEAEAHAADITAGRSPGAPLALPPAFPEPTVEGCVNNE